MCADINEWELVAEVAGWINEILTKDESLPFSKAKCEQKESGSQSRRDLTLLGKNETVVLTGEVKLPYRDDGGSPYNENLVQGARRKAQNAKSNFFFTWNVNECVLWETFPAETAQKDRKSKSWSVTDVHKPSHFEAPSTAHRIRSWLTDFLSEFAEILRGKRPIGTQSPDQKFIEILESALNMPILLNRSTLEDLYKNSRFQSELDKWMRDEQGWIIDYSPEAIRDNMERASKFACYALVNKLVFHEALLKRHGAKMEKLSVPDHIDTGNNLRLHLERYFAEAKMVTGDYETVFGEEHIGIGNRIPFYSDKAVPHWRELVNQIHRFDFSRIDYEVIGSIFERLISPNERHKYGQFYTRVEVVDLINSFCIRRGDERILDPACGGGTFLVRAYARKRELDLARKHGYLLKDLFGIDLSQFPAHLTTINLATRDLIDDENYPQILRSDFFDVLPEKPFVVLPKRAESAGLGKIQHRTVEMPPLDAVVGNPPYIRQEQIPQDRKSYYQQLLRNESRLELSGRSDIHCYFWIHAASYLKDSGYLAFLTSSQWLDVEYGFRLQEWMLKNFEMVAVLESLEEPWFVGARVVTAITVLRRQKNEAKRMNHLVRFVQFRRPIGEILGHDGTTTGAFQAVDRFRNEILGLKSNAVNEYYRARVVRQRDLWNDGVCLGIMMGKSGDAEEEDGRSQHGDYYGGKWGVHLRAPDLWFDLLDRYGSRLAPLGNIAEIRFGVKSGRDVFFFPVDCSMECLNRIQDPGPFEIAYGVPRRSVQSGKVKLVRCGEGRGRILPIESKYLEPEIHSLMEVKGFVVKPEDCNRQILVVSGKKSKLKGTYVLDYIEWGEECGYHEGSTCSSRVTEKREWYDLTGHRRTPILWPKERQYRHIVPTNDHAILANCRFYEIYPQSLEDCPDLWAGALNSTFVLLSSLQFGRPVGNEGNWSTMIVDVNMMLVPDPRKGTERQRKRVARAFAKMKERNALQFLSEKRLREMAYRQKDREWDLENLSDQSELDMPDRRELDDAVLELLGERSKSRREEILNALYSYLREFFESIRRKEEKAIENKNRARRHGQATPREIAAQIFDRIHEAESTLLRKYDPDFLDRTKTYDTIEIPETGLARQHESLFEANGVSFVKGKKTLDVLRTRIPEQDRLVIFLANSGFRGLIRIPHEAEECRRVLREFRDFVHERDQRIRELIDKRTADEDMQAKIRDALMPMLSAK
ncbi:MAG TPA: N-6 DNA methylase [bacterium]|nr:N-6 DNA methylase [bacterium]